MSKNNTRHGFTGVEETVGQAERRLSRLRLRHTLSEALSRAKELPGKVAAFALAFVSLAVAITFGLNFLLAVALAFLVIGVLSISPGSGEGMQSRSQVHQEVPGEPQEDEAR